MTSINQRGFSGVYDADEHIRMAQSLQVTPTKRGWNYKLDDNQILEIRQRYASGDVFQQQLADEYDVSQTSISNIVRQITYSHSEATNAG